MYVVDSSRPLDENDRLILEFIQEKLQKTKVVVLLNKQDLDVVVSEQDIQNELQKYEIKDCTVLAISPKLEQGIPLLEDTLKEMFHQGKISFNDEVYITNMRQKEAIAEGLESLKQVKESILNQMPEDFYSIDLMNAYEVLGQVIGETVEEDLVNKIFSEFCVGK